MGACFQAKRLASDLDLISSSGSLPVQPVISGLGQERSVAIDRYRGTQIKLLILTPTVLAPIGCNESSMRRAAASFGPKRRDRMLKSARR